MANSNNNNNNKGLDPTEAAKMEEGLGSDKVLDYSSVDQGQDIQPSMTAMNTIEAEPKAGGKGRGRGKGKGKGKKGVGGGGGGGAKGKGRGNIATISPGTGGPTRPLTAREQMKCSNCLNPMTMSKGVNYQEIKGKKSPMKADGKTPVYKSPNTKEGKLIGVLCDDCQRNADAGKPVYITTAVVENTADGTISNIPVSDIPSA